MFKRFYLGIFLLSLTVSFLLVTNTAFPQDKVFPSRPIEVLIPWAPGGGMDVVTRALLPHVEKNLKQPVISINRTGASGTIAFNEVARANPDGYLLLGVTPSILITQYTMNVGVNFRKYDSIILVTKVPGVFAVSSKSPWKNLKEFLHYSKDHPNEVMISNSGAGGMWHIFTAGFEAKAGLKFKHIPFSGGAPATTAVVGGHIHATMTEPPVLFELYRAGRLRILGVTAKERYFLLPDIPTFIEQGVDFEAYGWWGYLAPKGTPKGNLQVLHDAFKSAMETDRFKEFSDKMGMVSSYKGLDDYEQFLSEQDQMFKRMIEKGGIQIEK